MARNKRIYTKVIAISQADKEYIQQVKREEGKHTEAGALAMIIDFYKKNINKVKKEL